MNRPSPNSQGSRPAAGGRFLAPYAALIRLNAPVGTALLLLPCLWGLGLSAAARGSWPPLRETLLFALGAFLLRSAGCVINDMADRDFDARVARTAARPLASGALSLKQALAFLALLLLSGLGVLLSLNSFAVILGLGIMPLVVAYPFAKRFTHWPQLVLGLVFNWGALMGYGALEGRLSAGAFYLYAAGVFWTLGYDTIYAHQDREDDARIGVKSTARHLGAATPDWVFLFFAMMAGLLVMAGHKAGLGAPFYAGMALVGAHLFWQAHTLDINDAANCAKRFKANALTGALVLGAILAGARGF